MMHRQGSNGHSSLVAASLGGHVDVVIVLLKNDVQVNLQDSNGQFLLMAASHSAWLRCC